jgi:hypothetical protein
MIEGAVKSFHVRREVLSERPARLRLRLVVQLTETDSQLQLRHPRHAWLAPLCKQQLKKINLLRGKELTYYQR